MWCSHHKTFEILTFSEICVNKLEFRFHINLQFSEQNRHASLLRFMTNAQKVIIKYSVSLILNVYISVVHWEKYNKTRDLQCIF